MRIASRNPRNAVVISLLSALGIFVLAMRPDARSTLRHEWARWRRLLYFAASATTIATAGVGLDIYQWAAGLPLWVDEEMIALNLRDRVFADLAGPLWLGQSAPFGWLVLERAWMLTLGTGERALRLVPLMFGIATIAAGWWVGRRWMGRIGAAVFVLLCWIGPALSHYRFEVKHYSADIFSGLLIPVLAAWAIEADDRRDRMRRAGIWWAVAAVAHWFANGAVLVTPACALLLFAAIWRRDGKRPALWFSLAGLSWLVSFLLHYQLSIRDAVGSPYLRSTWADVLLPPALGLVGSLRWLVGRLEPLAIDPAGTTLWLSLWLSAAGGLAFGARRSLGLVLAGVTLSAFPFAAAVPLHQRFSLWIVPALYAGVALLIARAVDVGRASFVRRKWTLLACTLLVLAVEFRLCADIVVRGRTYLEDRRRSSDKHQLDDRAAVRWLMSQWVPGDILMTTHLTLPAVWWYSAGRFVADGSPIYEVAHTSDCGTRQLENALRDRRRVLLYLGFDVDPGVDDLFLRSLGQLGGVTAHREFNVLGRAAVVDLRAPPSSRIMELSRTAKDEQVELNGCTSVRPAERW